MKKYKVYCPFCECSFDIGDYADITCMCGVLAFFENGHLDYMRGNGPGHYFELKNLITGKEYVEADNEI